jgi:hypothetical protein
MIGSIFPFGKDSEGTEVQNVIKTMSYSSIWIGKRRWKIQIALLIYPMCFLINNQFVNKQEKKAKKPLLLLFLLCHQDESPAMESEVKSD